MLESITVKNLALIRESEVNLRPGLNILTGETGAGKSIILGSIRLALGERAGKDVIRRGEEYALVELTFTSEREEITQKMKELDIPIEPDGSIFISRRIQETRSVCKCNGETISSRALKELASMLINIHGQNDTQTLLNVSNYQDILDEYGDETLFSMVNKTSEAYKAYKALVNELEAARGTDGNKDKDVALARFEIDEIEAARLVVGEDTELEDKYRLMKNGQKIAEALGKAYQALDMDSGAGAGIGYAVREVGSALALDEGVSNIADGLATVEDILKDVTRNMQDYIDRMDFSEMEYRETESRLDTYNHLKSKYGDSVEKVLAYAEERSAFIAKMEDYDAYIADLEVKVDAARAEALKCARKLSELRREAGASLEKKLTENLIELNFGSVDFKVDIQSDESLLSAEGMDKVDFLVSFNAGEPVKSLSQVASGGELSRFMLALKAVTADKEKIETLVFDEIDAGISGKTAWSVSQKMSILGKDHQVIAITHLPQIAAMADTHFLIEKKVVEDTTVTDIRRLAEVEKEQEIARMLSGGELTEAGISNAKELLESARSCKM